MNKIFLASIFLLSSAQLSAQGNMKGNSFGKEFMMNLSGTYINNKMPEYLDHTFHEYTLSAQAGMSIVKSLSVGFEVLSIYTHGSYVKPNNYFLKGIFAQYDVLPKQKVSLIIQTSFLNGDYCTCDRLDPHEEENLNYVGAGIGLDYPIRKSQFYFVGSFNVHWILNYLDGKYNYNIYKIGLSYKFGKGY